MKIEETIKKHLRQWVNSYRGNIEVESFLNDERTYVDGFNDGINAVITIMLDDLKEEEDEKKIN